MVRSDSRRPHTAVAPSMVSQTSTAAFSSAGRQLAGQLARQPLRQRLAGVAAQVAVLALHLRDQAVGRLALRLGPDGVVQARAARSQSGSRAVQRRILSRSSAR